VRVQRLQEQHTRFEYLTEAEIGRFLAAAAADQNLQVYAFVFIAFHTAMRAGEILSIRREDVDLDKLLIRVPVAKTVARDVPISPNLKGSSTTTFGHQHATTRGCSRRIRRNPATPTLS
jgi:integrase